MMYEPTAHMKKKFAMGVDLEYNGNPPRTAKLALEYSITKWFVVLEQHEDTDLDLGIIDGGWMTCQLCTLYFKDYGEGCEGCPIEIKTGASYCESTPYTRYISVKHEGWRIRAAKDELQFLQDLHTELYGQEKP